MFPEHQVFHRCIWHLQLPSSDTVLDWQIPFWACHPVSLALAFSFIFLVFFWPNTRPSDWQASQCQSLGRSPKAPESYMSWGSVFKELDQWESGLESLSYCSAPCWVVWLTLEQCGVRPEIEPVTPAVEAWGLNHWTTREVSSFGFLSCIVVSLVIYIRV